MNQDARLSRNVGRCAVGVTPSQCFLQTRDSPTPSSVSTMSEWEDYNETLAQVLTWLLQAETQLKQQTPVSEKVDVVKEQFREHEVSIEPVCITSVAAVVK